MYIIYRYLIVFLGLQQRTKLDCSPRQTTQIAVVHGRVGGNQRVNGSELYGSPGVATEIPGSGVVVVVYEEELDLSFIAIHRALFGAAQLPIETGALIYVEPSARRTDASVYDCARLTDDVRLVAVCRCQVQAIAESRLLACQHRVCQLNMHTRYSERYK